MSLNRFTNIDEVLGYVPVFGETIPMESREALKEYILQLTENDLKVITMKVMWMSYLKFIYTLVKT
jgi:hypothetical protein